MGALHRVRNKKELNAKLKGATLGDTDRDVDDTLKWIKRSKKKEKELAKKRQEELEHMDKVFQGDEYTESTSFYPLKWLVPDYIVSQRTSRDSKSVMTLKDWTRGKLVSSH